MGQPRGVHPHGKRSGRSSTVSLKEVDSELVKTLRRNDV